MTPLRLYGFNPPQTQAPLSLAETIFGQNKQGGCEITFPAERVRVS